MEKVHINQYITFYINHVSLSVFVNENLKTDKLNFGYIEIGHGQKGEENLFWDNLDFFIGISKKDFNKECAEELKSKGIYPDKTRKIIKKLIKNAIKKELLWKKLK